VKSHVAEGKSAFRTSDAERLPHEATDSIGASVRRTRLNLQNVAQNLQEVASAKETAQGKVMQPITVDLVESGADVSGNDDALHEM
jgi:hypothetical protein